MYISYWKLEIFPGSHVSELRDVKWQSFRKIVMIYFSHCSKCDFQCPLGNLSKEIHPWSLTWNLKINPWKRRFLLEIIIFRFHVKLWGCTYQGTNISPKNGILKMIFLFPRWDMLIPWRVPTKTLLRFGPWPFPFQLRLQGDPFLKPITEPRAEFVTLALAWCFFWGDGVAKDGGWFSEFSGVHPPNKNRPKVLKSFIQSPEFSLTNYSPKDMCPVEVTYICKKNLRYLLFTRHLDLDGWIPLPFFARPLSPWMWVRTWDLHTWDLGPLMLVAFLEGKSLKQFRKKWEGWWNMIIWPDYCVSLLVVCVHVWCDPFYF